MLILPGWPIETMFQKCFMFDSEYYANLNEEKTSDDHIATVCMRKRLSLYIFQFLGRPAPIIGKSAQDKIFFKYLFQGTV
jgi:hypothetical protein